MVAYTALCDTSLGWHRGSGQLLQTPYVPGTYCCITNHPKIQWPKTTCIYVTHDSVGQLGSSCALGWLTWSLLGFLVSLWSVVVWLVPGCSRMPHPHVWQLAGLQPSNRCNWAMVLSCRSLAQASSHRSRVPWAAREDQLPWASFSSPFTYDTCSQSSSQSKSRGQAQSWSERVPKVTRQGGVNLGREEAMAICCSLTCRVSLQCMLAAHMAEGHRECIALLSPDQILCT